MKFYWIASLKEYDQTLTERTVAKIQEVYVPVAEGLGLEFCWIRAENLGVVLGDKPALLHEGRNILEDAAVAYVSYANPRPFMEKYLETVARIAHDSDSWTLMNKTRREVFFERDKFRCLSLARSMGIPAIKSAMVPEHTSLRNIIAEIEDVLGPYPYIVKPNAMYAGLGIVKAESQEQLLSLADIIQQAGRSFLIQEFIPRASDLRVYMKNNEILACQRREPPEGSFLANITLAGTGAAVQVPEEIEAYSRALAAELSTGNLCIDWLVNDEGVHMSEVESTGGATGLPEPDRTEVVRWGFQAAIDRRARGE